MQQKSIFGYAVFNLTKGGYMIRVATSPFTELRMVGRYFDNVRFHSQTAKQIDQFTSKLFEKQALNLIFGKRKYLNFTTKEKRIVDLYQEKTYQDSCGCVVLPNTQMDLEQRKVELLLAKNKE